MNYVQSTPRFKLTYIFIIFFSVIFSLRAQESSGIIYHDSWIDLNKNRKLDPYENPKLDIEKRIDDLLSRMTLEEKTCQLATLYGYGKVIDDELPTGEWKNAIWKDGIANIDEHLSGEVPTEYSWPPSEHARAINRVQRFFIEETRLGIPVDFTNEGIQGLRHDRATTFPSQPGMGSSWDVELAEATAHVTGKEARILGYTNIYAPILDIARDPRWGRTMECFSEDPYLASRFGMAQVKALQSEGVVSTPKHFAVHSIPKGGREDPARTDPKAPWWDVETIYLAPFRAAIKDAGALGVMSSFNDYNGVPIAGNKKFLTHILRERWGFKGYVVSDSRSIKHLQEKHEVASTYKEAIMQAVTAGLNVRTDFDMPENFIMPLRELVGERKVPVETIDELVKGVLRVKFWLGLFENPYVEVPEKADKIVHCEEHRALSLKAAQESIVLLKNEGNILPLSKDIKSILVTGPNAMSEEGLLYEYGPKNLDVISVLEGIREGLSSKTIVKYARGCELIDDRFPESDILYEPPPPSVKASIQEAVRLAKEVDVTVVAVGETNAIAGEGNSRLSLNLPGYQQDLIRAIHATGTPTVVVLLNGRPLSINWVDKHIPAVIEAWFPGEYGGKAIADVLFGGYNPGGKLSITFPKSVGQIPMNFPYKKGSQLGNDVSVSGVLYPFGHGLSYTEFKYNNLEIIPKRQKSNGNVKVSFEITNVGDRKGDEVVQLYIQDAVSNVVTFEKELKGFKRITLEPGESKAIVFTLKPEHLQILNKEGEWRVEPGTFEVMVGSSSEDIRLEGSFEIVEML